MFVYVTGFTALITHRCVALLYAFPAIRHSCFLLDYTFRKHNRAKTLSGAVEQD